MVSKVPPEAKEFNSLKNCIFCNFSFFSSNFLAIRSVEISQGTESCPHKETSLALDLLATSSYS